MRGIISVHRVNYFDGMADVLFYHLTAKPLDAALPELLERSLQRGWNVVVQASSEERIEALNASLWSYTDESFLPHGSKADGQAVNQPIWLTHEHDNPNGAQVRFIVDGATPENADDYERVVYMFDGNDPDQLAHARTRWKVEKGAGHAVTYWAQNEMGRWEKKA